jgi:hypothetical protein
MTEMKISELSIGDWVRMGGGNFQIYHLTLAGDVYGYRRTNDSDTGEEYYDGEIGEIEPIPLTPEILEKNGFVKDEEFICHSLECDEADFVEYTIGMNRLYVKSGKCDIALTIKYVHQLQHALRLAGVEKEIEV